jgi:MoaA/NifB/PqqE/SkfB family radical SAM enzyme
MDADALFQEAVYQDFPVCTQVTLLHGICDSYCVSCPLGRARHGDAKPEVAAEFSKSKRRHLDFDLFRGIADEVACYPHAWLRLHARGEPLLHARFVDMVSYAKQAGVRLVQTFTDAIALDSYMAIAILNAGLDVLECSVHGHVKSYEYLMRNGKYQQVVDNIIRFRCLRDAKKGITKLVV